jgi:Tol biopolymer transport system component
MAKWAISGVLALILTVTASSAMGAYPGTNGRIAFYRADGHIYSVRPDGTGLIDLGPGRTPSYSPDGKRLAFASNGNVWTMNADGGNRRRVTKPAFGGFDPTWSPDGKRLAFASDANGGGLFTVRSTAPYGVPKQIVATPVSPDDSFFAWDYAPAWSTNGLIYFTRWTDFNGTLCEDGPESRTVNPANGQVKNWGFLAITADPGPGGRAVVYHYAFNDGSCNRANGIFIANADGTHERPVTPLRDTTPRDTEPVFSPDATKVAFQRGRYVMIVNANGTGLRRLVVGSAPSWQPLP